MLQEILNLVGKRIMEILSMPEMKTFILLIQVCLRRISELFAIGIELSYVFNIIRAKY